MLFRSIDDVVFIGQTLWTDFNNDNIRTKVEAQMNMNDFRVVKNSGKERKFIPDDALEEHKASLAFIDEVSYTHATKTCVVVGHHAPSPNSVKPHYERDYHMNGAYRSDLENFIKGRPQIKLWIHGHTHHEFDYMVGSTRVVCNPRGYVGYERGTQLEHPYYPQVVEI